MLPRTLLLLLLLLLLQWLINILLRPLLLLWLICTLLSSTKLLLGFLSACLSCGGFRGFAGGWGVLPGALRRVLPVRGISACIAAGLFMRPLPCSLIGGIEPPSAPSLGLWPRLIWYEALPASPAAPALISIPLGVTICCCTALAMLTGPLHTAWRSLTWPLCTALRVLARSGGTA